MASSIEDSPDGKKPLYIFYDCRTTDRDLRVDKIIEIAGVIFTSRFNPKTRKELKSSRSHEFTSLCYSDLELGPSTQKLTGFTKADLKEEPPLDEVLMNFFEWIDCSVCKASEMDDEDYMPVLVAHSGNALDFFMLFKEIDCYPLLIRQFKRLDLHYLDTYYIFQELKTESSHEDELASLSIQKIYRAYFKNSFDDSKAINSAKALCKVFAEGPPSTEMELMKKYTQSRKEMEAWEEEVKKFREAWIRPSKAKLILSKGVTYDTMVKAYRKSPKDFRLFLKKKCGIVNARPELIYHFRTRYRREV